MSTTSLRIALVVHPFTLRMRGAEHPPALARELLGRGHTVRGFGAPPATIPRSGPDPSVDGGVAPEDGLGMMGFKPDVIVAYDALSPAAWMGARRARKLGVPLVLVEQGVPEVGRPFERFLRSTGQRLWGAYVRAVAERVVAVDGVAKGQALREGFAEERVSVVPAGVDLTAYRPDLTSHLPSRHGIRGRFFLYMGRIEEGRGLDCLCEAFARTAGRGEGWSLVLAGEGGARPHLRALVERLGVGSRVHWIPRPRDEERAGLLGSATFLAAPALDDDAGTTAVRQALACGQPVLGSTVARIAELVEADDGNQGCGLLAAPGDLDAWSEMLRLATSSPVRRARWRKRARQLAEETFAWPRVTEAFEAILVDACAARARVADAARAATG